MGHRSWQARLSATKSRTGPLDRVAFLRSSQWLPLLKVGGTTPEPVLPRRSSSFDTVKLANWSRSFASAGSWDHVFPATSPRPSNGSPARRSGSSSLRKLQIANKALLANRSRQTGAAYHRVACGNRASECQNHAVLSRSIEPAEGVSHTVPRWNSASTLIRLLRSASIRTLHSFVSFLIPDVLRGSLDLSELNRESLPAATGRGTEKRSPLDRRVSYCFTESSL